GYLSLEKIRRLAQEVMHSFYNCFRLFGMYPMACIFYLDDLAIGKIFFYFRFVTVLDVVGLCTPHKKGRLVKGTGMDDCLTDIFNFLGDDRKIDLPEKIALIISAQAF